MHYESTRLFSLEVTLHKNKYWEKYICTKDKLFIYLLNELDSNETSNIKWFLSMNASAWWCKHANACGIIRLLLWSVFECPKLTTNRDQQLFFPNPFHIKKKKSVWALLISH